MKKIESNIEFINQLLEEHYYSKINSKYVPCVVESGSLQDGGKDLYIKTILINQDKKIDSTWVVNNLAHSMSDDAFNCIVTYNYKFNTIYGINSFLMDDYYTVFVEQKNLHILDMVYNDSDVINKPAILKSDGKNLFIYYDVLKDKLPESGYFPTYKMYAELEYREYIDDLEITNQNGIIDKGYVDVQYFKGNDGKNMLWIRATIEIDTKRLVKNYKNYEMSDTLKIKVVDLETGKLRALNPNNYDDDIHAGLIVFRKDSYQILSKYYYFYDMMLISKDDTLKSCLIDNHEDCFVFWEGEFNSNLPFEIKMELSKYNDVSKTNHLLSKGMFEWQLNSNWNYLDDALPNEQLANYIRNNFQYQALEIGLDFYPPKDINSYSSFVNKVFELLSLTYATLRIPTEKEELLTKIRKCENPFSTYDELYNNYQGFCYLIYKVLENGKK